MSWVDHMELLRVLFAKLVLGLLCPAVGMAVVALLISAAVDCKRLERLSAEERRRERQRAGLDAPLL